VPRVQFQLNLTADSYLRHYQGRARSVVAIASDGRRIAFPAERLRPFVTRDGVSGRFELVFDDANRFVALERVGDL